MTQKICERCGEPVIKYNDQYEVFEKMHWTCFHFTYEHGKYEIDEPCDDPSCPCRINRDWKNESDFLKDNSINIVSVDKKSIVSMKLQEEDIRGYGFRFNINIKDIDFGWQNSDIWIEKGMIEEFINKLKLLHSKGKGKAFIEAMSPKEFELEILSYDNSGHTKLKYLFGKNRPGIDFTERLYSEIVAEFEIYPTELENIIKKLESVKK